MKLLIPILSLLFVPAIVICQPDKNAGTVDFYAGLKERGTLIYTERLPYSVRVGNIDVLQQPDMHISGPGINLSERINLTNNWSLTMSQTIRYDYVYQRMPIEYPEPENFHYYIGKKVIFDFYADVSKNLPSKKKSYFSLFAGAAICGLNSDFDETLRIYRTQSSYTDFVTRKNFIFPAVSTGFGWQWKNLYAELKLGYCWNNPTLWRTPFIFPEFSCQYKIFSTKKKEKK